ncbi:NAD(P)/FAD-dependent oxidoreductase [Kordiimonas sp.]|uniref:NAD(P)/FAD-dependent oxidoreductase n=1 Tax=Kordiimonas sp. TaxID=1970157 RepID=UPI003A92E986
MSTATGLDLLVIGGGLHGCATALFAAKHGMRVTVLEKDSVARHASGTNAGGVRRLWRNLKEVPLANRSMEMWKHIGDIVDDDCGFQQVPQIKVAENAQDLDLLRERADLMSSNGFDHERMIDQAELRDFLPAVNADCVGGLMSEDGFALPWQTTAAFARKARALGVNILSGIEAKHIYKDAQHWRVETSEGAFTSGALLNCAGAWAGGIAAQLGDPAPVEPVAPLMIVTQRMRPFCNAVVGTARRPLSFKQMENGTVVIGGARLGRVDTRQNRTDIDFAELTHTARTARDIFPVMRGAVIQRTWSGIEARTPDQLPVIGRSMRHKNAYHSFGFSAHGFQLGPATGSLLADFIATGKLAPEIAPFPIDRFASTDANTLEKVFAT